MYSSRFFGSGIFPCGDVLAEEDPESFADEWLDEKQLGEECKRKVVTHKLNPVGKHSDNIKSLVVGIVQECGMKLIAGHISPTVAQIIAVSNSTG